MNIQKFQHSFHTEFSHFIFTYILFPTSYFTNERRTYFPKTFDIENYLLIRSVRPCASARPFENYEIGNLEFDALIDRQIGVLYKLFSFTPFVAAIQSSFFSSSIIMYKHYFYFTLRFIRSIPAALPRR